MTNNQDDNNELPAQEFDFSYIKLMPFFGWWRAVLEISTTRFSRACVTVVKQAEGNDPTQAVTALHELLISEIRENQAALKFFEKNITVV